MDKLLIKLKSAYLLMESQETYKGEHESPDKSNGAPLYNVIPIYPNDFYTNTNQYIQEPEYDHENINVIKSAVNKPNKPIKIYRAVPKSESNQEKLARYSKEKAYIMKYGELPPTAEKVNGKVLNRSQYYDYLYDQIQLLQNQPDQATESLTINSGDWISINKKYAVDHGKNNLNNKYRILSKVVPASTLYTDGNSLSEWGYNP